jgi:hypothetical protein
MAIFGKLGERYPEFSLLCFRLSMGILELFQRTKVENFNKSKDINHQVRLSFSNYGLLRKISNCIFLNNVYPN